MCGGAGPLRMAHETSDNTEAPQPPRTPDLIPQHAAQSLALEDRARMFLESIGHDDHPLAVDDPLYALYQVAVDYRCMAQGYEGLLKRERATDDA